MDLKRWLMALALAALFTAPIGPPTAAFAAAGQTAYAGAEYHDQEGEGDGEGDGEGEGEGEGEEGDGEAGVLKEVAKLIERISDLL